MPGQTRHRRLIAFLALPLLAGCAHNDVLVFGTNTTLGINVQSASAGVGPSVVVGYERQEAVWMPLLINARDTKLPLCPPQPNGTCAAGTTAYPVDQAMYRSTIRTPDGRAERTDAYSVFASLGADFNGSANGQQVAAGGGLAQFFATGNAALNVSSNAALVTALKIESGQGADAQAKAVEADSGAAGFDTLLATLTPQQRADALAYAQVRVDVETARLNRIMGCSRHPQSGAWRWPDIAKTMTVSVALPANERTRLETITNESALRDALHTEEDWQVEAERAAKTLTFC